MTLGNTEKLVSTIDLLTEVHIVDFVDIALVHVTTEDHLDDVLGSLNAEEVEDTEELVFSHVAVARDVVVLKHWLQVDALVFNSNAVLVKHCFDFTAVRLSSQVLSAGEERVILGDCGDAGSRVLVNAGDSEGSVDVGNKVDVPEEALGVGGLVFLSESFELVVCHSEVHGGENRLELVSGDATLAQLIKIAEELFDSDALHHNSGLQAVLNIRWVVRNVHMGLAETVVDNVKALGVFLEEGALLLGANADLDESLSRGDLRNVGGEHVLGAVDVLDEVVIVDFLGVAAVAVTANDQVEFFVARRHDVQVLHNAKELLGGDVLGLGSVKVLEAGLKEDAV